MDLRCASLDLLPPPAWPLNFLATSLLSLPRVLSRLSLSWCLVCLSLFLLVPLGCVDWRPETRSVCPFVPAPQAFCLRETGWWDLPCQGKPAWSELGLVASAVRDSRIGSPDRTPAIDLKNRFYAVLQAPGLLRATIFKSSAGYWNCIGSLQDSPSISQSFPSEAEAKIYLQSAGEIEHDIAP